MLLRDQPFQIFINNDLYIAFEHLHREGDASLARILFDRTPKQLSLDRVAYRVVMLLAQENRVVRGHRFDDVVQRYRIAVSIKSAIHRIGESDLSADGYLYRQSDQNNKNKFEHIYLKAG